MVSDKIRSSVANGSAIRAMFREGKELAERIGAENVFDFSLGNPYTPTPAAFGEAIKDLIENEDPIVLHGYTDNEGYADVRGAIAANLNERFGSHYEAKNIIMTVGAASALNIILRTLLNPGEEVLFCRPYFTEYRNYVANNNGVYNEVLPTDDLQVDLVDFEKKISANTRAIIVNTPNNPSGAIYTDETLKGMAEILRKKEAEFGTDIYIISDEPYRELVYDGYENPFLPDYYENTIVAYSFSKSLSLPGERIGYLAISDDVADSEIMLSGAAVALRTLGFVNAPSLIQKAVARCLNEKTDVAYYDRNRKLLYESLTSYGFSCIKPQGAFYLMVKAPSGDDAEFVKAAKKYNILFVGGTGFGAPGYVRIAYCCSYEKIERSLPGFKALAADYGL